ncbi:MAG: PRD domain-containing protein [Longicatena sp.]
MKHKKRINNNVVIAIDDDGKEQIITGKGLGFDAICGALIDESRIEKIFTLKDSVANERLRELLTSIPVEHVTTAEDIMKYAQIHINNAINENVIISLSDHIYMAVERKKQDIEVKNVMLWDIKKFYRDEYRVGTYALQLINERFHVLLSEDEAGFIALHLVNAQLDVKTKSVKAVTQVMQEIETIVRMTFSVELDVESVYYYRFITHLKFFAERLFSGKTYGGQDVDNMLTLVEDKYPQECACVEKIAKFIKKQYGYTLSEEEVLYLSIHISRIVGVST